MLPSSPCTPREDQGFFKVDDEDAWEEICAPEVIDAQVPPPNVILHNAKAQLEALVLPPVVLATQAAELAEPPAEGDAQPCVDRQAPLEAPAVAVAPAPAGSADPRVEVQAALLIPSFLQLPVMGLVLLYVSAVQYIEAVQQPEAVQEVGSAEEHAA